MSEFVRVKQKDTGHELSVPRSHFEAAPDGAYAEVDKPATDTGGTPLPPKYKTTVTQAAGNQSNRGQTATTTKES